MRREASLPNRQYPPVVRKARVFDRDTRLTVHQSHEIVASIGDIKLVQQEVFHGQESCRAF